MVTQLPGPFASNAVVRPPARRGANLSGPLGPWLATGLVLVAFGLRAYLLPDKPVWYDEAISSWTARLSLPEIALYQARAVHPPLHYWFLHLWGSLAGQSEYALRFLSLATGLLTVALLYRLGHRALGPGAGLVAALLLALSPFHIAWSQQIRMYSLATLLGLASVYLLLRILAGQAPPLTIPNPPPPLGEGKGDGETSQAEARGDIGLGERPQARQAPPLRWIWAAWTCPHRNLWAAYAIANALALYTLYLSGIVLIMEALVVLAVVAAGRRWRLLAGWAVSAGATALVYLPWLYLMKTNAGARNPITPPYDLSLLWRIYYTILSVGVDVDIDRYAPVVVSFLGLVLLWLALAWRDRTRRALAGLLTLMLVLPPALVYAMSLPKTMFYTPAVHARYFVLFLPLYLLLLSWGLVLLRGTGGRRWGLPLAGAAAALLAGITLYALLADYYPGRFQEDDWPSIAATVRAHRQPQDAVLLYPDEDWCIFLYHYAKDGRDADGGSVRMPAAPGDPPWYPVPYGQKVTAANADGLLRPIAEQRPALWVVESVKALDVDPDGQIGTWLRANYRAAGRQSFGDKTLTLYSREDGRAFGAPLSPSARPAHGAGTEVVPGLRLLGYDQALHRAPTGAVARVALYWQAEPGVQEGYQLEVHLNREDASVGLARPAGEAPEGWPAGQSLRETYELPISSLMPTGAYTWELAVRDRQTGGPAATVPLGHLDIVRTRLPMSESAVSHLLRADLGGEVEVIGYDATPELPVSLAPGDRLGLSLYWRGQRPMERSYTVFVQLVGEQENPRRHNPVWAQQDSMPGGGLSPTTGWAPGEIVKDSYSLTIEAGTPPGTYAIHVGMYDRATGQRLPLLDTAGRPADNKLVLGEVMVR